MKIGDEYIDCYGNKVIIVSDDYTGLNRDIVYAQFSDRGVKKVTKEMILKNVQNILYTMAIWGWEKKGYKKIN